MWRSHMDKYTAMWCNKWDNEAVEVTSASYRKQKGLDPNEDAASKGQNKVVSPKHGNEIQKVCGTIQINMT